ncbi:MAG: peptidoglycan DD-metalloendopeptidase family protein [Clostridia bacterium]|nr:peptidoglycan DD-metalloendopeptidase family protein [Clostridia bacterium]
MFENIYTTKMSASQKQLQNRFIKIRSKSSKISRLFSLILTVCLILTMLCATVVLAVMDGDNQAERTIVVCVNGQEIEFAHEPFVQYNSVYLPLREFLEQTGVTARERNSIEWDNGTVYLTIENVFYDITIGESGLGISHEAKQHGNIKAAIAKVDREMPAILKNDTTFVPYWFIDYMLYRGSGQNDWNISCIVDGNEDTFADWDTDHLEQTDETWGLTMMLRNVSPVDANLMFRQAGGQPTGELQYGDAYTIERYDSGKWSEIPTLTENVAFHALAYKITKDQNTQTYINWESVYGQLTPGRYRLAKEIMDFRKSGDYDTKTFYAEFTVTDFAAYFTPSLVWPSESLTISRGFETRTHPLTQEVLSHNGIDIIAAEGSAVHAATGGMVTETGFDTELGNYVIIENQNHIRTKYASLAEIHVVQGAVVNQRDVIGTVGNTGMSTGAHLHFEMEINGKAYDPELVF